MAALAGLASTSCTAARLSGILGNNIVQMFRAPDPVANKLTELPVPGARLAATWIGHATVLLQLDDRFVLTDPVFTETVGNLSPRLIEPGVEPEHLPALDAVVISHMHFDHLSLGSLDQIEDKVKHLYVPEGGALYVPRSRVLPRELSSFETVEQDGLRITATPVRHVGWRYGLDRDWMNTSFTGYVIEYHGLRVYFGGDTGYDQGKFRSTAKRLGPFDLVLMPIAPIEPRDFMCRNHTDPKEALDAFEDLQGRVMLPIHFDTFINSLDERGVAPRRLLEEIEQRGYPDGKVALLNHGERRVFIHKPP